MRILYLFLFFLMYWLLLFFVVLKKHSEVYFKFKILIVHHYKCKYSKIEQDRRNGRKDKQAI